MGGDPLRGAAFTRLLRLVQMLDARRNGVEVDEAAEELGIGRRTVYRDFLVLESSGFPLTADHDGRRARWKLLDSYRHRLQLSLTWTELFALVSAQRALEGLQGTLFHDSLKSALDKIRATLPSDMAKRCAKFAELASAEVGGRNLGAKGDALRTLAEAVEARHTVVARYRPLGPNRKKRTRRIDPYHLRVAGDGVYILGWCHARKAIRTFLLDRFDSVEQTEDGFELRGDVASELEPAFQMWSGRPRRVRFVVSPDVAQLLLERKPHPSAVVQRLTDGSAEVRMTVAIGPPLIAYLSGLGGGAREIGPVELREAVRAQHEDAIERLAEERGSSPP